MKATALVLFVMGLLFALTPALHAQETKPDTSCTPVLGSDDEVAVAARAYQEFWATEFQKITATGVGFFPDETIIPAAEKLCSDVVKKASAHNRSDIADAATLVLDAFKHSQKNLYRAEKSKRSKPKDPKLAELYGENPAGPTEGYLLKGFLVAQVRFAQMLGPTVATEKQIRAMPDIDFTDLLPKGENVSAADAKAKTYEDLTLIIKSNGTVFLDGKKVESDKALAILLEQRSSASAKMEKKLRITLEAEENVAYERIQELMNVLATARLPNVKFAVGGEEF